jgi:hypothetical protein
MGIMDKIKKELFSDNKRIESSIKRTYKISFEELSSLLNTNDEIKEVIVSEIKGEKFLIIETEKVKPS